MFIFTAKFNRKKAIAIVLALAVLLIVIILIAANTGNNSNNSVNDANDAAALSAVVKNNEQRVNYLNALGWEVEKEAIEEQEVVIPREFNDVYTNYNALQKAQGFDLSEYGGLEAMRYTYKVLNYPDATGTVVADIIVYRNEVIAGDVQSTALDGFMVGLEYPKTDTLQTEMTDIIVMNETSADDAMSPTEVPDSTPSADDAADNTADNTADNACENNADSASENNADSAAENNADNTADENTSLQDSAETADEAA